MEKITIILLIVITILIITIYILNIKRKIEKKDKEKYYEMWIDRCSYIEFSKIIDIIHENTNESLINNMQEIRHKIKILRDDDVCRADMINDSIIDKLIEIIKNK